MSSHIMSASVKVEMKDRVHGIKINLIKNGIWFVQKPFTIVYYLWFSQIQRYVTLWNRINSQRTFKMKILWSLGLFLN